MAADELRQFVDVRAISGDDGPLRVPGLFRGRPVVGGVAVVFRRLDRIRHLLAVEILLSGDVADDSGQCDGRVDVGRRTGVSEMVERVDHSGSHVIVHGDDAVDSGVRGRILLFETIGDLVGDARILVDFEGDRLPLPVGRVGRQQSGRTVCRALLEIRLQHGPGACEGLLGEFVVTAVSGCGVGQQELHGLRIVLADGVELQFVGKLARLDLPDAFGCRQFDESVGGEVLHWIGHEHHVHARVLGQLQCVRHTGHRFRGRRVGCVIRAGCIRRFGCVSRFRCIR